MSTATRARAGFTLLEVLISISILLIITSIVYASLSSVVTATEIARVSADEMRMRQFLVRSFQTNFSTIVADPVYQDERYVLIGISEDGPRGSMDSIEFACSAPVIGGASPPGAIKRVYYGAVANSPGAGGGGFFGDDEQSLPVGAMKLESSEQMMLDPAVVEEYGTDLFEDGGGRTDRLPGNSDFGSSSSRGFSGRSGGSFGDRGFSGRSGGSFDDRSSDRRESRRESDRTSSSSRSSKSTRTPSLLEAETQEAPGWKVPVDQFDVSFFDGYEWVEDWDSIEFGRMPWAVRIRLNYARSEEEYDADREAGISQDKDFDFETVFMIPIGAGLIPEEEKVNGGAGTRSTSSGNLFGESARDQQRRSKESDRGKDQKPRGSSSRSDRDRKTDRDSTSGFGRSRSGMGGGGSLFGN
ncbi:MAG: prepilin-type N-terminal cleavage/methylation domain-containing protein [Candidatus Hydrogenedentes bacterium]|nr:prepilin-type N-terminal cleavage/methylation domain-containing protein [Candidatus Hydrogenedentota bacterium]